MTEYLSGVIARIQQRIVELSADQLVETNEGTYGSSEACRNIGTGESWVANYKIFQTLSGKRYIRGCDPEDAPGYARKFQVPSPAERRQEIAELTSLVEALKVWPSHQPLPASIRPFSF